MVHLRYGIYVVILAGFIAGSCTGNSGRTKTKTSKEFSLPVIPAMMDDPQQQVNYLAEHYWNNFDFNDTSFIHQPKVTEMIFTEYLKILMQATASATASSIRHTLEQALENPQAFTFFTDLLEKYLYNPNSPLRNEEIYSIALEYILAAPQVDELKKVRSRYQLEQLSKNRVGKVAVDFVYTLANGKQGRMHHLKSDYLVLFFNNPDCAACKDIQHAFEQSPVMSQMQKTGALKILAIYVDQDTEAWQQYQTNIPKQWINGYDASYIILGEDLYDLRAIPSLYLLDKDKRVVLRDVQHEHLEQYLSRTTQDAG